MAERRMFSKKIVGSDSFLLLPTSVQALYFSLCMNADDDGFVANPIIVQRMVGASHDDLKTLLDKRFLLGFEDSDVVVIKHWKVNNLIPKDRYKPTLYEQEKALLFVKENGVYTDCIQNVYSSVYNLDTTCIRRLGKESKVEESGGESALAIAREATATSICEATATSIYGKFNNVNLTDAEYAKLKQTYPDHYDERIERFSEYMEKTGKTYKHHFKTIMEWAKKDGVSTEQAKPKSYDLDEFFEAAVKKGVKRD
jgi:hypothetical protein